jgi:hypothetical protein
VPLHRGWFSPCRVVLELVTVLPTFELGEYQSNVRRKKVALELGYHRHTSSCRGSSPVRMLENVYQQPSMIAAVEIVA